MAKREKPRARKRRGPAPRKRPGPPNDLIVPPEDVSYVVDPADAGTRLDRHLRDKLKWRSRTKVQELIATREITVDGKRRDRAYKLKAGETIEIPLPPPPEEANRIHEIPLHILYEDEHLIVLNKQPNIVVHPVGRNRFNTLINALHLRYRDLDDAKADIVPKLAHRIDRETSGVLVAVKCARHDRSVPVVFEHTDVLKEYLAIAEGAIEQDAGEIDLPIGPKPGAPPGFAERVVREDGQPARTAFAVIERFADFTFLRLRIFTGRQHQIRVHLQSLGHPVLCDGRYGLRRELRLSDVCPLRPDEEDRILIDRQALHSHRLGFPHPVTGEDVTFEAPLPEDLSQTLEALRRG